MRALLAAALILTASSAYADWQYTKWGMTVDEVVAASKGAAVPVNSPGKNGKGFLTLLSAPFTGSGQSFTSFFRFDPASRKLIGVELRPTDASKCRDVKRILLSRYGSPFNTDNFDVVGQTIHSTVQWRDPKKGELIDYYTLVGEYCTVRYMPLEEEGPKGEL